MSTAFWQEGPLRTDSVSHVLSLLHGVRTTGRGWMALCPAHEDATASLSIAEGDDQPVLLKCFAGCPTEHVLARLGLTWADLGRHVRHPHPLPRREARPTSNRSASLGSRYTGDPQLLIARVWRDGVATAQNPEVEDRHRDAHDYIGSRGLATAIDHGVVGIIGRDSPLPPPLSDWWPRSYRLFSPLYDVTTSALRSLQARAVDASRRPKSMNPVGLPIAGACFANALGLQLLRGEKIGHTVVFGEGLSDFWALSAALFDHPVLSGPGVGVAAKAIGPWVRRRRILCALDNDDAGHDAVQGFADAALSYDAQFVDRVIWPNGLKDAAEVATHKGVEWLRRFLLPHMAGSQQP